MTWPIGQSGTEAEHEVMVKVCVEVTTDVVVGGRVIVLWEDVVVAVVVIA